MSTASWLEQTNWCGNDFSAVMLALAGKGLRIRGQETSSRVTVRGSQVWRDMGRGTNITIWYRGCYDSLLSPASAGLQPSTPTDASDQRFIGLEGHKAAGWEKGRGVASNLLVSLWRGDGHWLSRWRAGGGHIGGLRELESGSSVCVVVRRGIARSASCR